MFMKSKIKNKLNRRKKEREKIIKMNKILILFWISFAYVNKTNASLKEKEVYRVSTMKPNGQSSLPSPFDPKIMARLSAYQKKFERHFVSDKDKETFGKLIVEILQRTKDN